MSGFTLTNAKLVLPGEVVDGHLCVSDGLIQAIGQGLSLIHI